ncbi:methyl-galactoside transport system permease protein [Ruminiclostridium sufflavum DSM 19573]|uniref:Methyl-galactoside transport system permease protein n=1 Tax=Ruminiclostridium sufflavum DSM 19573 TaxID=1121337 RepID=A0A318XPI2_9FIRM|nr:beta-methylgalactoside transporter [Ruminiclostridium sufflavum]PYG88002.1 methyl-galactoside transport system permease protein [Ruminiclostridium sufflavum DSM 19573]
MKIRDEEIGKIEIKKFLIDKALILALIAMIIVIIIIEPAFLQWRVAKDIMTQSSVKLIVALGLLFPLLLGGTDLSGGRQVGLAAVIVASMSQAAGYASKFYPDLPNIPIIVPIIIAIVVVAGIGAVNGLMIAKLKMAPFIATFGMSTIVYGINCLYYAKKPNNAQPIGGIREDLTILSNYKIFGQISLLVVIAAVVTVISWFVLNKTVFGKHIYAVGGNENAARVSGVKVHTIIVAVFVIESILVGLAGILEVARTGGANSAYGFSYEFDAISACVVGGVSLSGGVGKVSGVVLGVVIFTIISYGLAFIGINPNWQLIVKGIIICTAVALDMRKNSK